MSKTIWDYAVSYGYGYPPGYGGFHSGEDRGNSSAFGLPIPVNGVVIGTVGWTGKVIPKNVYGTHSHVGKWKGGQSYDPKGGGAVLGDDAIVTEIDTVGNTDNGKFVRVRSQGFDWVYLHLNTVNVTIGQKLKGADMKMSKGTVENLYLSGWQRNASSEEHKTWDGKEMEDFFYAGGKNQYEWLWQQIRAKDKKIQELEAGGGDAKVLPPGTYKVN